MKKHTIKSILQLVAVVSVLVGAIMTSSAVLMMAGYSRAVSHMDLSGTQDFTVTATNLTLLGVASATMPLFWGAVLYFFSPKISDHIHGGQAQPNKPLQTDGASPRR